MAMEGMSHREPNGIPSFAHGLQILLVDHDTLSLVCMASLLQQHSFKVTTTALASVALSMIRDQKDHYNLVMANIDMPDMDSFAFLRAVHKKEIPLIFMSSEMNVNVARKALAGGACFVLEKPISLEDLKNVWQHVYRTIRDPMKAAHKPDCGKRTNRGKRPIDDKEEQQKGKKIGTDGEQTLSESINMEEEGMENHYSNGSSSDKKSRVVWTTELHLKFTAALIALGDQKARPKPILEMMKVPHITVRQVASHLQKYKNQIRKIWEAGTTSLPPITKSSSFHSRNEFPPAKQSSLVCQYEQGTSRFGVRGNTFQFPNKPPVMNQEQYYTPAFTFTGPFSSQNQNQFSTEVRGTTESVLALMPQEIASGNATNPDIFPAYFTVGSEKLPSGPPAMNQEQYYTPTLTFTGPFNSQNQNQFSTEVLELLPAQIASGKATNPYKFQADFVDGSPILGTTVGEAPPASLSYKNQSPSDFGADLFRFIEENPDDLSCVGIPTNAGDVNRYCQWLRKTLFENGTVHSF